MDNTRNMEETTGIEKLRRAIQRLVRSEDLWGWVMSGMDVRENQNVPLAMMTWNEKTKRYVIQFNPNAVDLFSLDELAAVLQHELIHRAMGHAQRLMDWEHKFRPELPIKFKKELINCGADCAVHELMDSKYVAFIYTALLTLRTLPAMANMYGLPPNMGAEYYVSQLLDMARIQKSDQKSDGERPEEGIKIVLPVMITASGSGKGEGSENREYGMDENGNLRETPQNAGDHKDSQGKEGDKDSESEGQGGQSSPGIDAGMPMDTGESDRDGHNSVDGDESQTGEDENGDSGEGNDSEEEKETPSAESSGEDPVGDGEESVAEGSDGGSEEKTEEQLKAEILEKQLKQDAEEQESHSQAEMDTQDFIMKDMVTRAVKSIEKSKGYIPGHISQLLKKLPGKKLRWDKLLKNFILTNLGGQRKRSWARPNRREIEYMPGRKPSKAPKSILFCIDTSGSMPDDDLRKTIGMMEDIIKQFPNTKVLMAQGDTRITHMEFSKKKMPSLQMYGRGGTDLAEFLRLMETVRADVNVIYTDGWDNIGRTAPKRVAYGKLVFLLTTRGSPVEGWAVQKNCMVVHTDC